MKKLSDVIEVERFKPEDEWLILSHMIMSDEVIANCVQKYQNRILKTKLFSPYFQPLFRWLNQYYDKYEKAPRQSIGNVFAFHKTNLGEEKAEIIETYLDRLADEYVSYQEAEIDSNFIIKEVVPRFIKKQEAMALLEKLRSGIDADRLDLVEESLRKAEKQLLQIDEDEDDPDLGTSTPGRVGAVRRYYGEEKDKLAMYRMPGAVGQFMGPVYRGSLYAVTGVEKSGKTHFMQEVGYQAAFHHKLKVLDINLEMHVEEKQERFWQRVSKMALEEDSAGNLLVPVFDCENNQWGTCEVRKRPLNKKPLITSPDDFILFAQRKSWKVCEKCRFKKVRANQKREKRFIPTIWFRVSKVKLMTETRVVRALKKLEPFGLDRYRVKCFPRFSATLKDIEYYIKAYIQKHNFRPDVILLDYPDIMAPVEGNLMDRFNIDYNWKRCAGMAHELNSAVFVADQAIKSGRVMQSLDVMSTSESKTKDAHIDMRLTLNKSKAENELGLQRLGMLFRRKGKLRTSEVMMTQRLETCHPLLDSEWWFTVKERYQVGTEYMKTIDD